jgi:glycine cleavage system H protein
MNVPAELLYTKDHEWLRVEGQEGTIGITEYAQGELGDIVFVEFPETGAAVTFGQPFGTIEAVKTVADLYSPVNGTVTAVNTALEEAPELVNQDPYGKGWLIKVTLSEGLDKTRLLSAEDYEQLIA